MAPHLEIFSTCIECDQCLQLCPENSITMEDHSYLIDPWTCTLCGVCIEICPVDAIKEKA